MRRLEERCTNQAAKRKPMCGTAKTGLVLNMASKMFCRMIMEQIKEDTGREAERGTGQSCTSQLGTLRVIVQLSIVW